MKKSVLIFAFILSALGLWAEDVPTLLVLTTQQQTVQIPISSIQKITYDKVGKATMYVHTTSGMQTYATANVTSMTLANVPEPTSLIQLTDSPTHPLTKIVKDGVVYVVKDGKLFTMKGEQAQ